MSRADVKLRQFKSTPLDEGRIQKIKKKLECFTDSDAIRKSLKYAAIHLGLEKE